MRPPLDIQQTIWLETPKGIARAKFLIDEGPDSDLQWVCFHDDRTIGTWSNWDVKVAKNTTMGQPPYDG